jgi:hypothetical protein
VVHLRRSSSRKRVRARTVTNSIGLVLRSSPCPQGEVGVSKHEAARILRDGCTQARAPPQDEVGAAHANAGSFLCQRTCNHMGVTPLGVILWASLFSPPPVGRNRAATLTAILEYWDKVVASACRKVRDHVHSRASIDWPADRRGYLWLIYGTLACRNKCWRY